MKRILVVLTLAAGMAACNSGNQSANADEAPLNDSLKQAALRDSSNYTTVEWVDSTFQDIGSIKKGQTVEIPFVVKNTGDKPLIISSVNPGCGCTVADKPEKPIMPGQEDKIVARYNSTGQPTGTHTKNVKVRANTKPTTDHLLLFKVTVTD
jgi:Protein of unknown function (DUF1573).